MKFIATLCGGAAELGAVRLWKASEWSCSRWRMKSIMMSRLASVYARERDYIIEPSSWTTTGLRIGTDPSDLLPHDIASSDLGAAVQKALSAAKEGIVHPTDWKAHLEPLLQLAKSRNWNAFQKSAKMCQVEAIDRELRITPSRNGGTSGPDKGYHPIAEHTSVLSLHASEVELGSAILKALALCS